jgi:hypothetical protein
MDKTLRRTCITVRKAARHPVMKRTLRSGTFLKKYAIRAATLSLAPAVVNDVVFHHAQLGVDEVVHVAQDTTVISTMDTLLGILMIAIRLV